jgi:hypothetical protein
MSSAVKPQTEWPWPDSLDALVAAPEYHTLLFENDHVRVVQTRIPARSIVPVHTHRWPCVLLISSWSHLVRRDSNGNVLLDTRRVEPPTLNQPTWQTPLEPHSVENVGGGEINTMQVEIKAF